VDGLGSLTIILSRVPGCRTTFVETFITVFPTFISRAAPPTYDQAVGRVEVAHEATEHDDIGKDFEKIALS
jgi:hypothetical protein